MSDAEDDDDWFTKDIEDFVITKKVEEKEDTGAEFAGGNFHPVAFMGNEFDGNYFDPSSSKFNDQPKPKKKTIASTENTVQKIPCKKLALLMEQKELELFAGIISQLNEFQETIINTSLGDDHILMVMKIINKICTLPFYETRMLLIKSITKQKSFWDQVLKFANKILVQSEKDLKNYKFNIGVYIEDFIKVLTELLFNIEKNFKISNYIKTTLNDLEKLSVKLFQTLNNSIQLNEKSEESNKFQIYPRIEDFKEQTVELRKNIVQGKFSSVEHYLDIHMVLLREDFMLPLRKAVFEYKKCPGPDFFNDNIRVHHPVKLMLRDNISKKHSKDELIWVDLDPKDRIMGKSLKYQRIIWLQKKRFMNGALLCFTTSAAFDDLVVGVVCSRNNDNLSNGYVCIEIINISNCANIFDQNFIMVESDIFFEPYHYVYNVLKHFNDSNFPFKSYIVDVELEQQFPDYIAEEKEALFTFKNYMFDVKNMQAWSPSLSVFGFNESQYEAYKLALTHKLAVIQGPPGTGKTFIGLEIAATLLENTDHQILVICLTNHSLDQFLCGIIKYTDSIVRMGSQSNNEKLDKINIKNLNEDNVSDNRIRSAYHNTKVEYMTLLTHFEGLKDYKEILKVQAELRSISKRMNEISQFSTYDSVKGKRIIGMTTTFAARNNTLLQLLKVPIVVIEEAAEVLESHVVAALSQSTQHLILIGDHFQLRPTTNNHNLCVQYKMDISLYERLMNNNIETVCLTVQHRMRPEIANLIRPTIYQNLIDSEDVENFPNIKGVANNVYFINHSEPENDKKDNEKSKKNKFEAQYIMALAGYLIHQGYAPSDVVILTTYNGQMMQLVQERRNYPALINVRITVVDNYQGEESRIILLSLVRSNDESSIGFLRYKNRVCVALSRAREGLYMIGNMKLLSSKSKLWKGIEEQLTRQNAIGCELKLVCQAHQNITKIKVPQDFKKAIAGGCQDTCRHILNCTFHQCESICHSDFFPHQTCEHCD